MRDVSYVANVVQQANFLHHASTPEQKGMEHTHQA